MYNITSLIGMILPVPTGLLPVVGGRSCFYKIYNFIINCLSNPHELNLTLNILIQVQGKDENNELANNFILLATAITTARLKLYDVFI